MIKFQTISFVIIVVISVVRISVMLLILIVDT